MIFVRITKNIRLGRAQAPLAHRYSRSKIALLAIALLVLLLSGCAASPLNKRVAAFSRASSLAVNNSIAAFDSVEQHYAQTQLNSLVVNYETNGFDPKNVRGLLDEPDLQIRKEILGGLQRYSESLSEISGEEQEKEFDAETQRLGQSLLALNNNPAFTRFVTGVPDSNLNVATTAINALGRWFVGSKKARELHKIISDMQPTIATLSSFLIQDIGEAPDSQGKGGRGLRLQLWAQYKKAVADQDAFIAKNKAKLDPPSMRLEIAKLPALVAESRKADLTLAATQRSLKQLVATHALLSKANTAEDGGLGTAIQQLVAEGQRIKSFYDSLENK